MDGDPFAQFTDKEIEAEYLRRLQASTDKLLEELNRQVSADFEEFQRSMAGGFGSPVQRFEPDSTGNNRV